MNTFVAFLRGINVGGRGRLLMRDLWAGLEGPGVSATARNWRSVKAVLSMARDLE